MPEEEKGVSEVVETSVDTPATEQPEVVEPQEDDFPQEPDKQREAFIKMRQELKELKSKHETPEVEEEPSESVLNMFRTQPEYNPQPITEDTELSEITSRMTQAERMAYDANQRATDLERRLEDERLYSKFPYLKPGTKEYKENPKAKMMEEYVAGQYLLQQFQGKKVDLVKLAEDAEERFGAITQSQKEAGASEAVEKLRIKEQGSLEARGTQPVVPKATNEQELRDRVRRGDMSALQELAKLRLE